MISSMSMSDPGRVVFSIAVKYFERQHVQINKAGLDRAH